MTLYSHGKKRNILNRIRRLILRAWPAVRANSIPRNLILLSLAAMMTLSPFEEMFRQSLANLRYDISTVSGILLEEPNFLYASRLSSDETTGSILYNPGYQPLADGVAGTVAGPKITAEFKPSPDSSVSVGDPLNEVSVTFKPKFKLEDPKSQDNKVIYPITGQDAAKVFTVKASGVKEDIILFSPDTDHASYTYEVVLSPGTE